MYNIKTALVLAPHTDDGEFGCGGTIAKLVEAGTRLVYVAFSAAEQSVLPHLPRDILRTEVRDATRALGIARSDCLVLDYQVRRFSEFRQAILDDMIRLNKEYQPELVFLPSQNDTHQDHYVIAQEGFRAFKRITMMGYEIPWNNLDFKTTCFSVLTHAHVTLKMAAVSCYKSQVSRAYAKPEFLRSLAVTRGVQIGVEYAEVFEVVRWVMN